MTQQITHMCIDLKGALRNWRDGAWIGVVTDDEGRTMEPWEVRAQFLKDLADGKRVIPMTSSCQGFDYQTGCPGHEVSE